MLNLMEVPAGALVRLTDGTVADVVESPGDGQWLLIDVAGDVDLRHAQDIVELVEH